MSALRRRLFASVCVLSLILCLATVGLWVRSYWVIDDLYGGLRTEHALNGISFRGHVCLAYSSFVASSSPRGFRSVPVDQLDGEWASYGGPFEIPSAQTLGFHWWRDSTGTAGLAWSVIFPMWSAATLFALAPAWWVVGPWRRQSKRRKLGLCLKCGYDLRATPQRCPECWAAARGV